MDRVAAGLAAGMVAAELVTMEAIAGVADIVVAEPEIEVERHTAE